MEVFNKRLAKMHSYSVAGDCVQYMAGYENYLMVFGNNDLMYFKNVDESIHLLYGESKNAYLKDERRNKFPYSQIPEHIERVSLFRKLIFANQIFDFGKPYILMFDGALAVVTVFKVGEEALAYSKQFAGKLSNERTRVITSKELEIYLATGSLEQLDENDYNNSFIFDNSGRLYEPYAVNERLEQTSFNNEKQRQQRIIDDYIEDKFQKNIKLEKIAPFIVTQKMMIKFKQNGEIKLDHFVIKYLQRGEYEITLRDELIPMESLSMLKLIEELPIIETMIEPKISLKLNRGITKEQLEKEKVLIRTKK